MLSERGMLQFFLLFSFFVNLLCAQAIKLPQAISDAISPADAKMHVRFLASDIMQGRKTGERGQEIAAEYIASMFEKLRLAPLTGKSYKQPFFYVESRLSDRQNLEFCFQKGKAEWNIAGSYLTNFMIQYSEAPQISFSAPLYFAGFGITAEDGAWDDFKGADLNHRVAVVLSEVPDIKKSSGESIFGRKLGVYRNPLRKAEWAKAAGASAMIVILDQSNFLEECDKWKRSFLRTVNYSPAQRTPYIPIIFVSKELGQELLTSASYDVEDIRAKMETEKRSIHFPFRDVSVKAEIRFDEIPHQSTNVVAVKEGTDPKLKDEFVFITAHYDHIGVVDGEVCNGADDNASGTAGMLEIANAFSNYFQNNKRSVVFVAFAGEELNLLGSRYFADNMGINPQNIVACLNLDMIGRSEKGKENSLYLYGVDYSDDLKNLNEECNQNYGFDLNYSGQFFLTSKSDQWPFIKKRIPGLFYFTGDIKSAHTPDDDYDKIDYEKLARAGRLAATVAYNLCLSDIRPQWQAKK